jgi:hypothetical protein
MALPVSGNSASCTVAPRWADVFSPRTFSQPLQATRLPVIHGQSRLRAGSFHKNKGLLTPWLMAVKYQA